MSLKAPFPYFGGKGRAADLIWPLLGDPSGYVEPFAGSAAVLLARPSFKGRRVETLNDADGWLVNAWRSIRLSPDKTAEHVYGPVSEIDYHARLAWLQERRDDRLVAWLEGDPENHDPKAAAWWLYVLACGIGDPWASGPWRVMDGHLVNTRGLPHLGDAGQGVKNYFTALATRLERVRITCGDWLRVCQPSVTRSGAGGDGTRAIFLDPPYATSGDLYAHGSNDVATQVRQWLLNDADLNMRIILCGYDNEHDELLNAGWTKTSGKAGGGAGYSSRSDNGRRERLWVSPACLSVDTQMELIGGNAL